MVSKHLGLRKKYERTVEIKVNEFDLSMIIRCIKILGNPGLIEKLGLKEKLMELKRYNNPKEKS